MDGDAACVSALFALFLFLALCAGDGGPQAGVVKTPREAWASLGSPWASGWIGRC